MEKWYRADFSAQYNGNEISPDSDYFTADNDTQAVEIAKETAAAGRTLCFEPGGCTLTFSEVLNLCRENLISADILYSENTENNGVLLNNDKRLDQIEEIPIAARLMAETLYDYYIAA